MTLPNKLSIARIFLVPVLVTVLLTRFSNLLALSIFLLASLTDWLDGYIARKSKQTTTLGKLLDPMADKLLISSALISLVEMGLAPAWIVVVIVSREIAITGIRSVAASQGVVIAASKMGKYKAVSEILAVSFLILDKFPFPVLGEIPLGRILLWGAMIMAIISGVEYVIKFNREVKLTT
ncbi:MAG: CDP-diacylglycerol--glycerol-3-phosphate 3-phosphatidyltransferase [bacterium]